MISVLEETLPPYLYANDFTHNHYKSVLKKLSIDNSEEVFNDKKAALIKALGQYFAKSYQQVDISLSFAGCSLKKHLIDPERPESYDRMVFHNIPIILDVYQRKEEFQPLPYLLSIPENIRTDIFKGYEELNIDANTARQSTREQFNTVFKLDERDIVFFLRGKISIRYFTSSKKIPEGADKRYAGESVEEMEELYTHYFPNGAWEEIESILGEVLAEKLNFSLIDNATFTRTFVPVFKGMVEILLLDIVSPEHRSKIEGFTGFVLRQYFHEILLATAKNLLEFIEERDKNAEQFIKYFSEEVVIDASGNKVQKYAIIDSKQQRWNYSSILSIMMQYKQAKLKVSTQKEAIAVAQERVNECDADIAVDRNSKYEVMDKIAELESIITDSDTRIMTLKAKTPSKEEEALSIKADIARLNSQQKQFLDQKKKETNHLELINSKIANKMNEFTRRQKKLAYEKKAFQTVLEQTASLRETYDMLAEALSVVLAKR